jgi:hypothetical protein
MKTYGGIEVKLHEFLNLALDGGEWSAPIPLPLRQMEKTDQRYAG